MDNLIYFHCLPKKFFSEKLLMHDRHFSDSKNEVFQTAANTCQAYLPITGC